MRDRLSAIRVYAGINVFMDRLSLLPGEHWQARLEQAISECDLFWLFWSRSAARSNWVRWEWREAVAVKPQDAIQLHPLERQALSHLPKELAHLHGGDALMEM